MARALERKTYTRIPEERELEVVRLYLEGWSAAQIGAEFGTTFSPVYRILKKHGVKRSKTGERNRKITESMKQLALSTFESGTSGRQAAEAAGISESSMSVILQEEGIPSRRNVREFTEEEELEIVERYKAGEWSNNIASDFGVFHKRVLAVCDAHGVPRRRQRRPTWTDHRGRSYTFRSSWELVTAKYLDAEGYDWDYEVQRFPIIVDGESRTYMPDFWITTTSGLVLVDVKGQWRREQRRRVGIFREQYPDLQLEIWGPSVLRSLGLLDSAGVVREVTSYG